MRKYDIVAVNNFIEADVDLFIIPNGAAKFADFMLKNSVERCYNSIIEGNHLPSSIDNDKFIESWIVGLGSDNVNDHGFGFRMDGKRYYIHAGQISRYIPREVLKNCKEGDTCILYYNLKAESNDRDDINISVKLHATCKQLSYRYRNFGPFEEVLKKVC